MQNDDMVSSQDKKLAHKYRFIREKIIKNYERACKYLKGAKITVAILFLIYTAISCYIGYRNGDVMGLLCSWVILIFINVFVFMLLDYFKYLVADKVIPYLNNDDELEYGQYDIFIDRDDLLEEEEEEED